MSAKREKVVVAMSGGVDSSVAACLLKEQGYDVMGLFMRVGAPAESDNGETCATAAEAVESAETAPAPNNATNAKAASDSSPALLRRSVTPSLSLPVANARSHQGCCSASDAADARYVAGMLDVPFYALNFEADFDKLIDYFADEYARGRTPNPCVVCNDKMKFGKVLDYADAVGAKYVATGHYARVRRTPEGSHLLKGIDGKKDQSYVLFGLAGDVLDRVMFPVGELTKSEVRDIARKYNLPNQDKPDSVEICFVPDRDYARIVKQRRPEAFTPGPVVDTDGNQVGTHVGIGQYTIGQRRGLGIAAGKPIYVTDLNLETNTVTVGDDDDLLARGLMAERVNLIGPARAGRSRGRGGSLECAGFRAEAKIRYLHTPAPARIFPGPADTARVVFDDPQRAITPGQAVVFYDGETVLGGGWIRRALSANEATLAD